jgi:hypothetical protein
MKSSRAGRTKKEHMKLTFLFLSLFLLEVTAVFGQNVGINTDNPISPLTIGNSLGNPDLITFRIDNNLSWSFRQVGSLSAGFDFSFYFYPLQVSRLTIKSNGLVGIGTTNPLATLHVAGSLQADAGLSVLGNIQTDKDLAVGGKMEANGNLTVAGSIQTSDKLILNAQHGIQYQYGAQQMADWRLIDRDDFETNTEGWIMTAPTSNAPIPGILNRVKGNYGNTIFSNINAPSNEFLFKKTVDLSGTSFSEVMVRFTYYFNDSWDAEYGALGYSDNALSTRYLPLWAQLEDHNALNGSAFDTSYDYTKNNTTDMAVSGFAMFRVPASKIFTLAFGSTLDQLPMDESFGIDNIEIWVR